MSPCRAGGRWTRGLRAAAVPLLDVRRHAREERVLLLRLGRMREEARRLEDRDRVVVLVQHLQRRRHAALDAAVAVPREGGAGGHERARIVHDGAVYGDLALQDCPLQPGPPRIRDSGSGGRERCGVGRPSLYAPPGRLAP